MILWQALHAMGEFPFIGLVFLCFCLDGFAWQQEKDWIELGSGDCRPTTCAGGCSHPWVTRETCACGLQECLDFAVYNGGNPSANGFQQLVDQTFAYSTYLDLSQLDPLGRGIRQFGFDFDAAAARCNASSSCTGFTCSKWSGRCYRFSSGSPRQCGQSIPSSGSGSIIGSIFGSYSTSQSYSYVYCSSSEVSYIKAPGVHATRRKSPAAVFFPYQRYGNSGSCYSPYSWGWCRKCTVYDQPSGALVPAYGVDGVSGRDGKCFKRLNTATQDDENAIAISMTDAQGQALTVVRMDTSIAMYTAFAMVQTHFAFKNRQSRTVEGRFRYILPPDAAVQRLSMKINGYWMEGEVVEKKRARQIWRTLLLQRRDPALLEQEQGNVYSMKIFPIRAYAQVEVILSYSVVVPMRDGVRRLVVPMVGLPPVSVMKTLVVLSLMSQENATVVRGPRGDLPTTGAVGSGLTGYEQTTEGIPMNDITIEIESTAYTSSTSFQIGKYTGVSHVLGSSVGSPAARPRGGTWRFYIDTSASTADTFVARQLMTKEFLKLLSESTGATSVDSWAFDLDVKQLTSFAAVNSTSLSNEIETKLASRLPLGMTRMDKLLQHLKIAETSGVNFIVIITDAIATLGDRGAALNSYLNALNGQTKVWVLSIGTKLDSDVSRDIAGLGGGRVVSVAATANALVAPIRMSKAWNQLLDPIGVTGNITNPSEYVYPSRFYDLRAGSDLLYFSWSKSSSATLPLPTASIPPVALGGTTLQVPMPTAVSSSFSPLLEREGIRAELQHLEDRMNLETNATQKIPIENKMVLLSTTKRVMCPLTSLLVLETEQDYIRFGINRNALYDVVTVTSNGVALLRPSVPTFDPQAIPFEMNASEPTSSSIPSGKGSSPSSPSTTSGTSRGALPRLLPLAATSLVAFASADCIGAGAQSMLALPTTMMNGLLTARCICKRVGAALIAITASTALQGCETQDNYGGCCVSPDPSWKNVTVWAHKYLNLYTKPTNRNRQNASIWAEALAGAGRASDLRQFAAEWLMWDPSNTEVYEHIGVSAMQLGEANTPIRAFTSIAEVASSSPAQLLRAAWLCLKAGDFQMAATLADRSILERDDNPNAYRALGIARYMQGDISGARAAYKSAKWRLSAWNNNKCYTNWYDQQFSSIVLTKELSHMEYHSGTWSSNYSILEGQCVDHGCAAVPSYSECVQAADSLNIALAGRPVQDVATCSTSSSPSPQCILDVDGVVRWPFLRANRGKMTICKCNTPPAPTKKVRVVLSWLGDGNDVDLHVKRVGASNTNYGPLSDVREGLGPELVEVPDEGSFTVGVRYNWAAAMGNARGVLVLWDMANTKPTILPFALPVEDASIWQVTSVAEFTVLSGHSNVTVLSTPLIR